MKKEESSITQPQMEHHETHHPTERITPIETPSESKDQSHLLQQAVVTPQNTYVREKFQNEGKWTKRCLYSMSISMIIPCFQLRR